jgi:hypothetical protein
VLFYSDCIPCAYTVELLEAKSSEGEEIKEFIMKSV